MTIYVYDRKDSKLHWTKTELKNILEKMQQNDVLETNNLSSLACSTMQILEIFLMVYEKDAQITINNCMYDFNIGISINGLLKILLDVEKQFVSKRTTDALARRKAKGLHLGRPKGRRNKALKLDEHLKDIKRYLKLNISKLAMAKLLKCHPQTLYDYITRKGLQNDEQ